jgi:hypothetical protein
MAAYRRSGGRIVPFQVRGLAGADTGESGWNTATGLKVAAADLQRLRQCRVILRIGLANPCRAQIKRQQRAARGALYCIDPMLGGKYANIA